MKLSDQIARISSDLEVALSKAAATLETYTSDKLKDNTLGRQRWMGRAHTMREYSLIDAAESARSAASDLSTNEEINDVIGALQSVEQE